MSLTRTGKRARALEREAPSRRAALLPAEVTQVRGGSLYVALEGRGSYEYGPVAWQRPITGVDDGVVKRGNPPRGTRCLVAHIPEGGGWWLVTFDGWPG